MPGGKVGGKLSKQALFEDIDFKLYNDGDKRMAFMTDKTRLPLWIKCLNDQYRKQDDKENAIDWKMSDQQAKLLAQVAIQYDPPGTVKLSNLAISFYLTTYRILIQGNECGNWCREMFPKLKESVEQASTTEGTESIDDLIAHLLQDMPTNAVNTEIEDLFNAAHSSQELSPRRRSLPHQKTIEYLEASIAGIMEENVTLKETIHSVTVRLQNLQHSLDTATSELEKSKLEIKQCHEMIEKERSLRKKIEEALQNQAKCSAEYHKKTTLQFDQIYAELEQPKKTSKNQKNVGTLNYETKEV